LNNIVDSILLLFAWSLKIERACTSKILTTPAIGPNRKSYMLAPGKKLSFIKIISIILHNEKEMIYYSSNFSASSLARVQHNTHKIVTSNLKE